MSVTRLLAMAALTVGSPLAAQEAASEPAAATTAALSTPDPERLAIAERLVDRIWPVGAYRRMMETSMVSTVDATAEIEAAADWSAEGSDKAARRAQHEARTGRPLSGSSSSAGHEGAEQMTGAMNDAMLPMYDRMEPSLRAALVRIYARRYDAVQLTNLETFFSTATGEAYAAHSLFIFDEPEMIEAMSRSMGEMLGAMMIAGDVLERGGSAADADIAAQAAANAAAAAFKVE